MDLALGVVLGVTLLVALVSMPPARWLGERWGLVDRPRPGELQRVPVPRTGGYGMILAFGGGVLVSLWLIPRPADEWPRLLGFGLGMLVLLPVALIDDRHRLGPGPQFLGQLGAALLPVGCGLLIETVSSPWGTLLPLPLGVALPLTLLWIVGLINTMNWLDTMDGLAAGIGAIAAAVLFWRSYTLEQYSIAALALALLAACLGFLPFNLSARLFMGTSGSMFLGYGLALLAIIGGAKIATAVMVLGLPLVDAVLVIWQRLLAGRSPWRGGDAAHLPHRLVALGLTPRQIVLGLYAACGVSGVLALLLPAMVKLYLLGAGVAGLGALAVGLLLRQRWLRHSGANSSAR